MISFWLVLLKAMMKTLKNSQLLKGYKRPIFVEIDKFLFFLSLAFPSDVIFNQLHAS
jgi:hypothetical protein